jgi:ABC-type glutathione transport system ATPase component
VQLSHEGTKILITGASGTGKSSYFTKLIIGYPAKTKLVFDHEGELQHRLKVRPARSVTDLANSTATGWCVFDPEQMFGSDLERAFAYFAEFAFQACERLPGTKLIACDEIQAFIETNKLQNELRDVLQRGRRRGLDAAMVSQAPNELHNKLRQQITEAVSFAQADERAIEWLRAFGFKEADLRALPPGHFVARKRGSLNQTRGKVF